MEIPTFGHFLVLPARTWPTIGSELEGLATPSYDLSAVRSMQMADSSKITFSAPHLSLSLPLLVRLLLVLLSQYLPSRVTAPIRDGRYCGGRWCSKVPVSCSFFGSLLDSPFSISDSPLVGLRPFSLPLFHPALRSVDWFCGSSLSLAVLAGLLPQVTIYDHCFTIVCIHLTSTSNTFICSRPIFTKFNRLSILVADIQTLVLFSICSIFQPMEQALPSLSDG